MLKNKSPKFYIYFAMWTLVPIAALLVASVLWFSPANHTDVWDTGDVTLFRVIGMYGMFPLWAMAGTVVVWAALHEALKALTKQDKQTDGHE